MINSVGIDANVSDTALFTDCRIFKSKNGENVFIWQIQVIIDLLIQKKRNIRTRLSAIQARQADVISVSNRERVFLSPSLFLVDCPVDSRQSFA
jgi:hypothetical protein